MEQHRTEKDILADHRKSSHDVAGAVLWVIDHCTRPAQDVAGRFSGIDRESFTDRMMQDTDLHGAMVITPSGPITVNMGFHHDWPIAGRYGR